MDVGDAVLAKVNNGQWVPCEVIEIIGDIVVCSGGEERRRANLEGRRPVGVGLNRQLVKPIVTVNKS
jgi:hypothetical protein